MVNITIERTFDKLTLSTAKVFFYPRKGFEDKQGSKMFEFYVVSKGHVPGIYTHWCMVFYLFGPGLTNDREDASVQVTGFKKSVHKKHMGWSAATQAWEAACQPVATQHAPPALDRNHGTASTPTTPRKRVATSVKASAPATPRTRVAAPTSPPATPSRPKHILYVYSGGDDTTVYADSQQAYSEMRRGLADSSFRKLEATPSVSNALAHATESALEVYNISDIERMKRKAVGVGGLSNLKKRANIFSLQSFGHTLRDANPLQARAGSLSADGCRADVQFVQLEHEHGSGSGADSSASFAPQDDGDEWQDLPENLVSTPLLGSRKRKWYATTDSNLRHWVENYRDTYLRVLVTREGPMGHEGPCSCECMLETHRLRPLCRIEAWTGSFFECCELRQLGLRVQLGHPDNQPCTRAHRGYEKFVVISTNGFHHVAVDFCQCRLSGSQHRWEQLLSYGWFPSMPDAPKSAITIPTLKLFHAVSLQGKTTVYHFFNALAKITDNTGSRAFKHQYQLALRIVREWRNLRALKRGGMGNDPDRCTAETRNGELAVDCITCPKVGVNHPDGWEKAPPEKRFLYAVYWAIDTCFRLKGKMISSWAKDPSIQDGWAYFTAWKDYGPFVKTLGEQKEMSTCTSLAALDHANTKYSQGYAATGCGMVTCGWHEVVAKNRVGDLQADEKYGNMDYIVASAWQHSKNLKERLLKLPPALRFHLVQYFVKFVIPKLHILGHLKSCQDFFSLLFTLGATQADMEGIERIWSSSGLMGASTREMGPGSCQDTLDDFWHFWNWNKVVGMGQMLRKRFMKATKGLARQQDSLNDFTKGQQDQVDAWKKAVDVFEMGISLVNPYELPQSGPSLRDIELELIREEQERERTSAAGVDNSEDTMTGFVMLGLEIEGQQRELAADLLANRSPTMKNLKDFVTRRTRIARQVKKLRLMQRKYSPSTLQRLATSADGVEAVEAENIPLFLPSVLSAADSLPPLSVPELAAAEAHLRDAQCAGSLDLIHHGLGVKRRLQTYKTIHSRHQHQTTRSRSLLDSQHRKIEAAAATYRQVRLARLALAHVAGSASWRPLEKADLRLLENEEEVKKRKQRAMKGKRKETTQENEQREVRGVPGMGEKSRLISWIWQGAGCRVHGRCCGERVAGWGEGRVVQGLRACQVLARRAATPSRGDELVPPHARVAGGRVGPESDVGALKCWREELQLLQEEMNWCLHTLEWQAGVWDQRATREHYSRKIAYAEAHLQGAMALAVRQAAMRRKLVGRFRQLWWSAEASRAAASSESSGGKEPEEVFGGHGFGNDNGSGDNDEGDSDAELPDSGGGEAGGAGAETEELGAEELVARRAEVNALLALQATSLGQYDDI
ncbi:hypothetical protein B0H14DRAFT_2611299 [Mycena olivaceomarginata]|nr:hypothetical protein B0H14DRAFT_2611299 [Mycena olivaceomarginata]